MKKNIVIFGGAFDPIHNGHLNMAVNAAKYLDAEVYFVPAPISVWKSESANIEDKINMINLAIKSIGAEEYLKISRFEADSGNSVNYSIDTVKYFSSTYKEHKIYLLIGSDQVNNFDKWKSAEEISKLVQIIYFERPDMEIDNNIISRFNMLPIKGELSTASSTAIRELKNSDTPLEVLNYIIDHDLYFINKIKSYLNIARYQHSVSVARLAYEIAVKNSLKNPGDYLFAGLLHDIGKDVPILKQKEIVEDYYKEFANVDKKIFHQFVGEYLAKKDFGISDENILKAIKYHTTGRAKMSDMEIVIYSADKIEPTRGFDSRWLINAIEVNLIEGFKTILKDNVKYFETNNIDYKNELTIACLDYYLK